MLSRLNRVPVIGVLALLIMLAGLLLAAAGALADARPRTVPAPTVGVSHEMTAAPDLSGYWDADTRVIHVADGASRFALEHERGHAFDDLMLDDGERNRFQHLYYQSLDLYWLYWDALGSATSSPSELFADAYASARLRRTASAGHLWETGYGYYPGERQHRRVTAFIRSAARTPGVPTTQVAEANVG